MITSLNTRAFALSQYWRSKREIAFYLIDGGISRENKNKLKTIADKYNIEFDFLQINLDEYEELLNVPQFTRAAYYRFDAPNALSHYKKILYLDCDIILNTDISELFDIDISENIIAVDGNKKGFFNSGVILINTQKWLEHDIKNKCIDMIRHKMIEDPEFLELPDQNTLIAVFAQIDNSICLLENHWNVREYQVTQFYDVSARRLFSQNKIDTVRKPKLIHNTDLPKPLDYRYTYKWPFTWFFKFLKYKNKTPWKNIKIENFNVSTFIFSLFKGLDRFLVDKNLTCFLKFKDIIHFRLAVETLKDKNIYLYGAGAYAKELIKNYPHPKLPVKGFIDADENKRGTKLLGYDIFHINDLPNLKCDAIVLTLANPKKYFPVIKKNIDMNVEYILL